MAESNTEEPTQEHVQTDPPVASAQPDGDDGGHGDTADEPKAAETDGDRNQTDSF